LEGEDLKYNITISGSYNYFLNPRLEYTAKILFFAESGQRTTNNTINSGFNNPSGILEIDSVNNSGSTWGVSFNRICGNGNDKVIGTGGGFHSYGTYSTSHPDIRGFGPYADPVIEADDSNKWVWQAGQMGIETHITGASYPQVKIREHILLGSGTVAPFIKIVGNTNYKQLIFGSTDANNNLAYVIPEVSGETTLGHSNRLWSQVFAATATINTSDERKKESIEKISDDLLDAWGEISFVDFQFKDAVGLKGSEKARIHAGVVAQRVRDIFEKKGLDASRYAFFCHDEWDAQPEETETEEILVQEAVLDKDGNIIVPEKRETKTTVTRQAQDAGDAYGIRYEEALCIEAAYQRRRADRLEARIAALEEKLA